MMRSLQIFLGLSCLIGSSAINSRLLRIRSEIDDDPSNSRMTNDMETFGNIDVSDYVSDAFGRFLTEGSMSMPMSMSMSMYSETENASDGEDKSSTGGSGNAEEAPPTPVPNPTQPPESDSYSNAGTPENENDTDEEERENNNSSNEISPDNNEIETDTTSLGGSEGDEADTDPPAETDPPTDDYVCGMPEINYYRMMYGIVVTRASTANDIMQLGSAHSRALDWIVHHDGAVICPDNADRVVQRYVMGVLYYGLDGWDWNNCRAEEDEGVCDYVRFMSDEHECSWYGVSCDENDVVTEIKLISNNLEGVLPDELYRLTSLKKILLEGNNILGPITSSIGALTSLEAIDLDNNIMSGNLPAELYALDKLQVIDLNNNTFYGELSQEISSLTNLQVLMLEDNEFSGTVPASSLAQLENLVVLQLHRNDFSGSVEQICDVIPDRREDYEIYLQFFTLDCFGDSARVACNCAACGCF
mmetsp:Transcript_8194/g.11716  ORF Transcript_8194/g.11716 Transcript_8194/m.11716 type:complete len:474 (+) Transcript_8194:126-1547(+)